MEGTELPFTEKGSVGKGKPVLWRKSKTGFRYVNFEKHVVHESGDGMRGDGCMSLDLTEESQAGDV